MAIRPKAAPNRNSQNKTPCSIDTLTLCQFLLLITFLLLLLLLFTCPCPMTFRILLRLSLSHVLFSSSHLPSISTSILDANPPKILQHAPSPLPIPRHDTLDLTAPPLTLQQRPDEMRLPPRNVQKHSFWHENTKDLDLGLCVSQDSQHTTKDKVNLTSSTYRPTFSRTSSSGSQRLPYNIASSVALSMQMSNEQDGNVRARMSISRNLMVGYRACILRVTMGEKSIAVWDL